MDFKVQKISKVLLSILTIYTITLSVKEYHLLPPYLTKKEKIYLGNQHVTIKNLTAIKIGNVNEKI